MSRQNLIENIYDRMGTKNTAELIAIWERNDHGLWSDSAFEVIEKLLSERGVPLPSQGEMRITESPSPQFEIPWDIPYLTWLSFSLPWVFFGLFLVWVFLAHPFYFFTRSDGPLWPHIFIRMTAYDISENIQVYGKIHLILHFIEFGIMSYGILMGYFVLRRDPKAIPMVKIYLTQSLLFSISLLLFFNVVPFAILYWEVNSSIFDLEHDWKMWKETIHAYTSLQFGSQWEFFLETLKVYWLPISATIIWHLTLIQSKWIATTFPPKPPSSNYVENIPFKTG